MKRTKSEFNRDLCHCIYHPPLACLADCISTILRTNVFLIYVLVPCSRWLNGRDGTTSHVDSCVRVVSMVYMKARYLCPHTVIVISLFFFLFYVHCPGERCDSSPAITKIISLLITLQNFRLQKFVYVTQRFKSVSQVSRYFSLRHSQEGGCLIYPHFPREIREFILQNVRRASFEDRNQDWKTIRSWK